MGYLIVFILILLLIWILITAIIALVTAIVNAVVALVTAVVTAVVTFALWFLAIVVGIAAALGIAGTLEPFERAFANGVLHRGSGRAQVVGEEPAFRSYWFGPVLRDFWWSLGYSARGFVAWMRTYLELVDRRPPGGLAATAMWVIRAGVWIGTPVGAVAGYLALAVVAVVGGLLLGLFVGCAQLLGFGLRVAERLRRHLRRAHFACDQCPEPRFEFPVYRCPGCVAEHRRLLPSSYGILWRRCRCDAMMLPTVNARGRRELPAFCPNGHAISKHAGGWEDIHIPIAGGPASGKTTLAAGAFAQLVSLEDSGKASVAMEGSSAESFSRIVDGLRHGTLPAKTVDQAAPALQAQLQAGRKRTLLYAYDLAGELYADADDVRSTGSLDNIRGVLLVVDPASIQALEIQRRRELDGARGDLKPSPERPADVYARLLNSLRERGLRGRIRAPLAVVVTKSDALGVEEALVAFEDAEDADRLQGDPRVRAWLLEQGETNLVALAEQDFSRVGWFSASALGRMPDSSGRPFTPTGTLEPFAWILRHNRIELPSPPPGEQLSAEAARHSVMTVASHDPKRAEGAGGARPARALDRSTLPEVKDAPRRVVALAVWAVAALAGLLTAGWTLPSALDRRSSGSPPPRSVLVYRWSVDERGSLTGKQAFHDTSVAATTGLVGAKGRKSARGVGRMRLESGSGRLDVAAASSGAKGYVKLRDDGQTVRLRPGDGYRVVAGGVGEYTFTPSSDARELVIKLRGSD